MNKKLKFTLAYLPVILVTITLFMISSCSKTDTTNTDNMVAIELALDAFVADLMINPPDSITISDRVHDYIVNQPDSFFGATVALLNTSGEAFYSPYWYHENGTLIEKDLADITYQIDDQDWLRIAIDQGDPFWTEPYFDAGGGDIWMQTYSVPVYIDGNIEAVATTDMKYAN
ncbi:MAG: hypothetical protein HQ470_05220 [Methylophilales bacterium]|jgi:hypothetical protein|nr:hypothetical protein [Methylophilales bacterium]|tara:strand:+ start:290 stop:808 length:519 start_codon:yes stop_codon:yes gene_type:complete